MTQPPSEPVPRALNTAEPVPRAPHAAEPVPPDAEACAVYLKALGDPWRLKIIKGLQAGPLSVSDLTLLLETEIANVSHHLRVLFHAGLVTTQRDGKFVYYHLNRELFHQAGVQQAFDFGCCRFELPSAHGPAPQANP